MDNTNSKPKTSVFALLALGAFALPFAFGGTLMALGLFRGAYDEARMQFWSQLPCTVLATEFKKVHDAETEWWRTTARYSYQVADQNHIGTRLTLNEGSQLNQELHRRLYAELTECLNQGKPYHCFVNLNRPDESILSRDGSWLTTLLLTIGTLLFGGIGYGLLAIAIFSRKIETSTSKTEGSKPWRERTAWRDGEIRYSDQHSARVLNWIGVAVMLFSIPSLIASGLALTRGNNLAVLGTIATWIGIWIQRSARRRNARFRRYGESTFKMASVPGVVGGTLSGIVIAERRIDSADGFSIKLCCTETSRSSDSDGGSSSKTVWEDELTVVREIPLEQSDGTAIPIEFVLPGDAPQSRGDDDTDQVQWKMSVRSLSTGTDYFAEFEVPVFRTSDSGKKSKAASRAFEGFQAPADPNRALKRSGLSSESLGQDGTRFIFPRGRNPGFAIAMAIVQTAFAFAIAAAFYFWWFSIWIYAAVVLGLLLLQAIADLIFFRSEVDVSGDGISVRSGMFVTGPPCTIDSAQIKRVFSISAGSAGNVSAYDLYVEGTDGKKRLLAKRIIPEQTVKELIQRMQSLLDKHHSSTSDVVN